jgi:hypothetical protein
MESPRRTTWDGDEADDGSDGDARPDIKRADCARNPLRDGDMVFPLEPRIIELTGLMANACRRDCSHHSYTLRRERWMSNLKRCPQEDEFQALQERSYFGDNSVVKTLNYVFHGEGQVHTWYCLPPDAGRFAAQAWGVNFTEAIIARLFMQQPGRLRNVYSRYLALPHLRVAIPHPLGNACLLR